MTPPTQHCGRFESFTNRRDFLKKAGAGCGMLALADVLGKHSLLAAEAVEAINPMAPRSSPCPARANSIMWLFMEGAPSAVDMFDPKPELTRRNGQRMDIDV